MRINRHDKRLDELLGENVEIEFTDGSVRRGILGWNERYSVETPFKGQYYHLMIDDVREVVRMMQFRKGHVKSIRAL